MQPPAAKVGRRGSMPVSGETCPLSALLRPFSRVGRPLRKLSRRVVPAAPRACGRRWSRSTASRAPPTTSPTKATRPPAERLAALDRFERALDAIAAGRTARRAAVPRARRRDRAPRACRSRRFRDLLSAFRQDVTTTRYATFAALLDYCRRSANPDRPAAAAPLRRRDARESRRAATRSARRCSSSISGRTSRSTGRRTASTCRRRTSRASASTEAQIARERAATSAGAR